jgi:hypothetical protein
MLKKADKLEQWILEHQSASFYREVKAIARMLMH